MTVIPHGGLAFRVSAVARRRHVTTALFAYRDCDYPFALRALRIGLMQLTLADEALESAIQRTAIGTTRANRSWAAVRP